MLNSKEIAIFKRTARQAYKLGEATVTHDYSRTTAQQEKMEDRLDHLDSQVEKFEDKMSDEQRMMLEEWVGENQLWGLLNIC